MRVSVVSTAICLSIVGLSSAAEVEAAIRRTTDIPAQGLGPALQVLAKDHDFQVLYRTEIVGELHTSGAVGELTTNEALTQLLSGTGLTYRYLDEKTVTIVPVAVPSSEGATSVAPAGELSSSSSVGERTPAADGGKRSFWQRFRVAQAETTSRNEEQTSERSSENSQKRIELEEILVTGTHIRGAEVSSPVLTITQEEMRLSGHHDLGEVFRAVPQNFSGGHNPGVSFAAQGSGAAVSNQNATGSSSLNLRGLGPDASLTLLNGARLPYDGQFQATDVSVIPVAAIDRVEILLDGASAIYGSDAVGGVANIILKRDYHGVEVSARYGAATDGGYEQEQYTAVAGDAWGSGGFLVSGDYSTNNSVRAEQRDYLNYMPAQKSTIYPAITAEGGLLSLHQDLGHIAEFALDSFYTRRDNGSSVQQTATALTDSRSDSVIWGVSPSLRFPLPGKWSMRLHGVFGSNEAEIDRRDLNPTTGAQMFQQHFTFLDEVETGGAEAEGPLFSLPGGEARLFVGGGYRKTTFELFNLITRVPSTQGADRSRYAYGELNLPLVSEDQAIPFVTRLSINGAVRREDYDSFGETTTPKIGATWGVAPGFDFKASWGRSFKVPTLREQFGATSLFHYPGALIPGAPAGTNLLALFGGSRDLTPERAEVITAGFVARPEFLSGLTLEVGWFDIDYMDRIVQPTRVTAEGLTNPALAPLVTLDPTIAQQNAAFAAAGFPVGTFSGNFAGTYDATIIHAILDSRFTNAATQQLRGIDLSARYSTDAFGGRLSLSAGGSWITDSERQFTSASPYESTAGRIYFPAKFKGRLGASWSRNGLTLSSNVNHVGGVKDINTTPNPEGDSMTTLDLVIAYQVDSEIIGGAGFDLAVINLFNERPPFLQPLQSFYPNYDSTNYSALGRVVTATVTKRF